jgi:hypothetical protein
MAITKVQDLTNIGTITTGDKLVGERVDGTTVRIAYAVDITLDTAPVLGGNLGYGGYAIVDNSNNELLKFSPVASAVNEITLANSATANYPIISATGGDTNINIGYTTKATGQHIFASTNSSPVMFTSGTSSQHTTTFTMADTANSRTVTWPDASGTVCYDTGSANIVTVGTVTAGTWQASIIGMTYGGTGANLSPSNGGIVYTNATTMAVLAGTATANKMLLSGSSTTPSWSTSTIPTSAGAVSGKRLVSDGTNYVLSTTTMPDTGTTGKLIRGNGTNYVETTATFADTYTASNILYSNGSNTVTGLATANNGVLVTNGSGVPSIATDIPTAVTIGGAYAYRAGGTDVPVADGGTGLSSATAYAVLCGGTTSTGNFQSIASVGTTGALLTSNGASALPTMKGGLTAFKASLSSSQTVVSAAITKVQCNSEAFDTGGMYDNATNYRYTPTIAGKYLITGYLAATLNTANGYANVFIYKNGAQISKVFVTYPVAGSTLDMSLSCHIDMNGSTDYIELYGAVQGTTFNAATITGCLEEPN